MKWVIAFNDNEHDVHVLYLSKKVIYDIVVKHQTDPVLCQTVAIWSSWSLAEPVPKEKPEDIKDPLLFLSQSKP